MRGFCASYRPPTGPAGGLPATLRRSPTRLALRPLFVKWSRAYGVPASLVQAIAWQESGWQADVTSSANAKGIGQLLPETATFVSQGLLGVNLNVMVASDNIQMMSRFLAYLLQTTRGDVCAATAAYYQGLGALRQDGVLPETQVYVRDVLTLRLQFS
jgi:soluble lytic murein transglycosylase-like protein